MAPFNLTPLRSEVVMVSKQARLVFNFMCVFVVQKHLSHSVPRAIGQCGLCLTFPLICILFPFFKGNSIYEVAFEKACTLLKAAASEKNQKNRKRVILFLTNGDPSDTNRSLIFKTIRDCNTELNNSIIIFTFGIGTVNQEILKDIATLNTKKYGFLADRTVGDITVNSITLMHFSNNRH